jgi:hypothetical protein
MQRHLLELLLSLLVLTLAHDTPRNTFHTAIFSKTTHGARIQHQESPEQECTHRSHLPAAAHAKKKKTVGLARFVGWKQKQKTKG